MLPPQQGGEGRRQGGRTRGRPIGERSAAASPGYRPDEPSALAFGEFQGVGQEPDGVRVGMPPLAALQQADRLYRQPGPTGELFLRETPASRSQPPELRPERGVFPDDSVREFPFATPPAYQRRLRRARFGSFDWNIPSVPGVFQRCEWSAERTGGRLLAEKFDTARGGTRT